jgi:hypothetical protein
MRGKVVSFLDWQNELFEGLDDEEKTQFLRAIRTQMESPVLARVFSLVEADALRVVRNYKGEGVETLQGELEVLSGLNAIRKRLNRLAGLARAEEEKDSSRG